MKQMADLYAVDLGDAAWRKSSYTANNGNCVEMCEMPGTPGVAVRDSKNVGVPAARVSRRAWSDFVTALDEGGLTAG